MRLHDRSPSEQWRCRQAHLTQENEVGSERARRVLIWSAAFQRMRQLKDCLRNCRRTSVLACPDKRGRLSYDLLSVVLTLVHGRFNAALVCFVWPVLLGAA
jgi:hypothetical protein